MANKYSVKKRVILGITCLFILTLLTACDCKHEWKDTARICVKCGLDERTVDEKFMESLANGLEARWRLTDAKAATGENQLKTDWENYFRAEYDQIKAFENEAFEDKNLEKWAKKYIDSIAESIEVLAYYGTNQWSQKYTNGVYHDRSIALYKIHDMCPVPVSAENQGSLLEILSKGEAISMIRPLLKKVEFKKVDESYSWKTYQAIVENTTTLTFKMFSFSVDLIDNDGVTIATKSAWAENWKPGEKVRFEFTTNEKFAEMNVEYASWNY